MKPFKKDQQIGLRINKLIKKYMKISPQTVLDQYIKRNLKQILSDMKEGEK
jgi:uncharacterized protein with HEPN domain